MNEPTHGQLLDAIDGLRRDLEPFVEMKADLADTVEIIRALKVGGKGVKWMASVATALLTLGGLLLAARALWQSFWSGA